MTEDIVVIDLEVNNILKHPKLPSFHWKYKKNEIVAIGVYSPIVGHSAVYYGGAVQYFNLASLLKTMTNPMLVGHNIKFDLLYLMRDFPDIREWVLSNPDIRLYDTQLAEYLFSAQTDLFPSLDHCCAKYSIPQKPTAIKEYWSKGISTKEIPETELCEYLEHDLHATYDLLYTQNLTEEVDPQFLRFLDAQMEFLASTLVMEWHGMEFDRIKAVKTGAALSAERDRLYAKLIDFMKGTLPHNLSADISPDSINQVSTVLFGGKVTTETKVSILDAEGKETFFKSGIKKGLKRTKLETSTQDIKGWLTPSLYSFVDKMKTGFYRVDDEVLTNLLAYSIHPLVKEFVYGLSKYRSLNKDITTYYEGYTHFVEFKDEEYSSLIINNTIHPQLNHCSTRTGRLSCSNPNLQNISREET